MGHLYFCIYQKALSVQMLSPDPFPLKNNTVFLRAFIIILCMYTLTKVTYRCSFIISVSRIFLRSVLRLLNTFIIKLYFHNLQ